MTPNVFKIAIQRSHDNLWILDLMKEHVEYPSGKVTRVSSASYMSDGPLLSVFENLTHLLTPEITAHDTQSPTH